MQILPQSIKERACPLLHGALQALQLLAAKVILATLARKEKLPLCPDNGLYALCRCIFYLHRYFVFKVISVISGVAPKRAFTAVCPSPVLT